QYKSNIVWHKVRKDGGSDGRGAGFYFRNVTELILFGVRGSGVRTLAPGRRQVNLLSTRKLEPSRKPDELYKIIESCSWGPSRELVARTRREKVTAWSNQAPDEADRFTGPTYGRPYSAAEKLARPAQLHLCEEPPPPKIQRRK